MKQLCAIGIIICVIICGFIFKDTSFFAMKYSMLDKLFINITLGLCVLLGLMIGVEK